MEWSRNIGGGTDVGTNVGGFSNTGGAGGGTTSSTGTAGGGQAIQTVFLILMENHNWSDVNGSSSAPYINHTLLPMAAHAEAYQTPPGNHPSEPNYIWLEAGGNLHIDNDDDPSSNHQSTTGSFDNAPFEAAGVSWKAYAEDISGTDCPQGDTGLFVVRHTPMLFFDDVTNNGDTSSQHCIQHVRPYTELPPRPIFSANTVARYNFITPDICHDMHGQITSFDCNQFEDDLIALGDTWLSTEIPKIMASSAYQNGGVIFVVWGTRGAAWSARATGRFRSSSSRARPSAGYSGSVAYTRTASTPSLGAGDLRHHAIHRRCRERYRSVGSLHVVPLTLVGALPRVAWWPAADKCARVCECGSARATTSAGPTRSTQPAPIRRLG